jgi:hypothetical protein
MPVMTRSQAKKAAEAAAKAAADAEVAVAASIQPLTGKHYEAIEILQRYMYSIKEVRCSAIKKSIISDFFNYILATPEATNLVYRYPLFKNTVVGKAREFYAFCSKEREHYDTYDNENRSIMIACSKILSTFA